MEQAARQAVAAHDVLDDGRAVHEREVEAREVERNGQRRLVVLREIVMELRDLLDDIGIEAVDQAGLFERGDEVGRRQAAMRRRFPARESLEAAELARQRADDRLVVDFDVAEVERFVEMLADVALHRELAAHLGAVDGVDARRVALDALAGELCFVKGARRLCGVGIALEDADAGFELDVRVVDEERDLLARVLDALLCIFCISEDGEVVGGEMREELAREGFAQDFRDMAQAGVSSLDAVRRVVEAEVREVEIDGAVVRERAVGDAELRFLRDAAEERVHAHELRDLVALKRRAALAHIGERDTVECAELGVHDGLHIALRAQNMAVVRAVLERQVVLAARAVARERFERAVVVFEHEPAEMAARVLSERHAVVALVERERRAVRE